MNPIERLLQNLRGWFAADAEKLKIVNESAVEIAAAQQGADAEQPPVDLQGLSPKIIALIQGQTAQITKLTDQVSELTNRDKDRDKAIQAAAAADQAKKISSDIEKAVADRKLAPKDETTKNLWKSLLESNYEQAKSALDALPAIAATAAEGTPAQSPAGQPATPDRATLVANARAAFAETK